MPTYDSSVETGDPLFILHKAFKHVQERAQAVNDDTLEKLREVRMTLYLALHKSGGVRP